MKSSHVRSTEMAGNMMNTLKAWGSSASTQTAAAVKQVRANLPAAEDVQKTFVATGTTAVRSIGQGVETIKNLDKVCILITYSPVRRSLNHTPCLD
jgi:hypothetical protein